MFYLKPLDTELLREATLRNVPVITVEDGTVNGGLGSAVAEWLAENNINVPLRRVGLPDKFIPQGTPSQLQHLAGIDAEAIVKAVEEVVKPQAKEVL